MFPSLFIIVLASQVFAGDETQFAKQRLRPNSLQGAPDDSGKTETAAATTATTKRKTPVRKPVDYSRLEVRVGKIISIQEIVTAHNLYVEEVDVGESVTRTVVSALVDQIPMEELENRRVIVLCNVRPRKIVGYLSEGMLLCAISNDTVEVLEPPFGSLPGEEVIVEGYEGEPDKTLTLKGKIFETVALDMRVNEDKVATYKGKPLIVKDKGNVRTETLRNASIA